MRWYWEGNELFAAIFGGHEIGVLLTGGTIENDPAAIRKHREHFLKHVPTQ
jgi:hypothetical protein